MNASTNNGNLLLERLEALERENGQLREALHSRIVIEQAKGILAERYRLEFEHAFELLRRAARSNRLRLHTLAASVTPGAATPREVEELLSLGSRPLAPHRRARATE